MTMNIARQLMQRAGWSRRRRMEGILESLPPTTYNAEGGLRQGPGHAAQSSPDDLWGHVSTQDYDDELRSEQGYVDRLYAKLDAERARVKGRYSDALKAPVDRMDGGTLVARDVEVRALAKQVARLEVA